MKRKTLTNPFLFLLIACISTVCIGASPDLTKQCGIIDSLSATDNKDSINGVVKKPYSMSPTTTSVRIIWQVADTDSLGIVYYGKTKELGQVVESKGGWCVKNEGYVHIIELTGLEPFTTYYYTVSNSSSKLPEIHETKTAPKKGTGFRIVSLADIHDNSGNNWTGISKRIVEQKPDLLFFIGDLITWGDTRPWNKSFFDPGYPALKKVPFMTIAGNHERHDKPNAKDGCPTPTTYFDYFSTPSHGYIDGSKFIDPRGESYYAMDYGDITLIGFDINGNPLYSPLYNEGSKQYNWLDEQLEKSKSKWIFMFGHVSIYTTGYHGQWSAKEKEAMTPLLEKHAAAGKNIIVFSADEHSFEHLYKAGVHYVRPGVSARNVREQANMKDLPYSIFYKAIHGFSTIDVSDNGEKVHLIARDSIGAEFYSYTFRKEEQKAPKIYLTSPNVDIDGGGTVQIRWTSFSPDKNAKINIYAVKAGQKQPIAIAENLASSLNLFFWNTSDIKPKGLYSIYTVIDDGVNKPITSYAKGKVNLK